MQNLNYYFQFLTGEIPLYGLIYISLLIGIVIGMLIGVRNRIQLRKKVKTLINEAKEMRGIDVEENVDEAQDPVP